MTSYEEIIRIKRGINKENKKTVQLFNEPTNGYKIV